MAKIGFAYSLIWPLYSAAYGAQVERAIFSPSPNSQRVFCSSSVSVTFSIEAAVWTTIALKTRAIAIRASGSRGFGGGVTGGVPGALGEVPGAFDSGDGGTKPVPGWLLIRTANSGPLGSVFGTGEDCPVDSVFGTVEDCPADSSSLAHL
jgi:hypothetical protein